jgi:glyoxylase-like metal-dependent hydrolase (beta-lactamase superfamily II)
VWDEDALAGIVIDPGGSPDAIQEALSGLDNVRFERIINTHGHPDHTSEDGLVKRLTGARVNMHPADAVFFDPENPVTKSMGMRPPYPVVDAELHEGDIVKVGLLSFEILHTPGHTPGGICLFGEGVLFSGDTLFSGTFGRYDLPGGSRADLYNSLKRLLDLPENTVVYPGHGLDTTIGEEQHIRRLLR